MKRTRLTLTPAWLEGLLLLTNAIPDLALVVDCVNCGDDRFATVGDLQDYVSKLPAWNRLRRAAYSDLKANDMVMGTEKKMRRRVAEVVAARHPPAVMLVQSTAVRLIGTDLQALAEELEADHGVPMIPVPAPPTQGDWIDGFDQGAAAIAASLPVEVGQRGPLDVGLVGHFLCRHEQDELGNVRELYRLQRGLGLEPRCLWFDGATWPELARVFAASKLVSLPGALRTAKAVAKRTGADMVPAPFPIGLDGTIRWLQAVAGAFGREQAAREFIDAELGRAVPRLDKVVSTALMHRRLGVVGAPDTCISLATYGLELGMQPTLCAVLSMRKAEGKRVTETLRNAGCEPRVVIDPEFQPVEETIGDLRRQGDLDLIVGAGSLRDAAKSSGTPYLEIGYPSMVRHALYDAPWLGFNGALWLAGAMFNLIHEQEYRAFSAPGA